VCTERGKISFSGQLALKITRQTPQQAGKINFAEMVKYSG
jgi:hypothetical protein